MAGLVEFEDGHEHQEPTPPITVVPPTYKGSTHDVRFESVANIITHIAGRQLFVDYYQQIKGANDINQGHAPGELSIYQQYRLIKRMELKVTSPFATSQNSENMEMEVLAEATMYATGLVPDRGDQLVFATGDGQYGQCEIIETTRVEFFKESTYRIRYQLKAFLKKENFEDLNNKVIETYVFDRNFLTNGRNPVIQSNDYDVINQLKRFIDEAGRNYFSSFFSREYMTLVVPSQGTPIYDPFLLKFIPCIFDTDTAPEVRFMRPLNVDGDPNYATKTIWDVLANVDKSLLSFISTKYYLVNTKHFMRDPYFANIYHSGIKRAIYPADPYLPYTHLQPHQRPYKAPSGDVLIAGGSEQNEEFGSDTMPPPDYDQWMGLDLAGSFGDGLSGTADGTFDPDQILDTEGMDESYETGIPSPAPDGPDVSVSLAPVIIHPYMRDEYYLFSRFFYNQKELNDAQFMSELEKMVVRMLENQSVGIDNLLLAIEQYRGWGVLERFYYIPVLVLLAKYTIQTY